MAAKILLITISIALVGLFSTIVMDSPAQAGIGISIGGSFGSYRSGSSFSIGVGRGYGWYGRGYDPWYYNRGYGLGYYYGRPYYGYPYGYYRSYPRYYDRYYYDRRYDRYHDRNWRDRDRWDDRRHDRYRR